MDRWAGHTFFHDGQTYFRQKHSLLSLSLYARFFSLMSCLMTITYSSISLSLSVPHNTAHVKRTMNMSPVSM